MNQLNRINLRPEDRLDALRRKHAEEIAKLFEMEEYIETFLNNKLCKSSATDAFFSHHDTSLTLTLRNIDMPTVIEHICGPVHRKYGIDWICTVPYNGQIELTAFLHSPEASEAARKCWWLAKAYFKISLQEGEMKSCEITRVQTRTKSAEEIERAVKNACDPAEYEYRIDCTGGDA